MAVIRADIQGRLGTRSVYDLIVEYKEDFSTDPMLMNVHAGSIALCLNLSKQGTSAGGTTGEADKYIKTSDGKWKKVT